MSKISTLIKSVSNVHRPNELPDFMIFTLPRSGSTWIMELLVTQPKFKYCSDPFDIRRSAVRKHLKINTWEDLYNNSSKDAIQVYINKIQKGQIRAFNPNPFKEYYRPFTSRIIFKCINFGKDRMSWFKEITGAKIIYSIRHPLAVAISRKELPRLNTFIQSPYINQFSLEQQKRAKQIVENGDHLEKATLSWCLQNLPALKSLSEDWAFITYEQLVAQPSNVIGELTKKLGLVQTDSIHKNLAKQSMVKNMSDQTTKNIFEKGEDKRAQLLSKWRLKIDSKKERTLFNIIEAFDIDIYSYGQNLPNQKYLIQ